MSRSIKTKLGIGRYLPIIFNISDLLIVNVAFALMLLLVPEVVEYGRHLRVLWFIVNICFVPVMWRNTRERHESRAIQLDTVFTRSIASTGIHALCFLSLITLLRINIIPLRGYLTMYGIMAVGLAFWTVFTHWLLKKFRRQGYNFIRIVIVGTGATARRFYEATLTDAGFGYRVFGFFDDEEPDADDKLCHLYRGPLERLDSFVKEHSINQIFFARPGQGEDFAHVVKVADDNVCDLYYVPQISRLVNRRFALHSIGGVPVMSTLNNPLNRAVNRVLKRTFDLVVSSAVLVFYPLVYIPVAIGIKLTSPGPIYFRQERTGYRGESFRMYKFRTMHVNPDSDKVQATSDDPRKTRFGNFLRRTSLDEIPQFINVWLGDMSIVGPRPHMLKQTTDYTRLIDQYMVRHVVKPGITGWAQVNGFRGITDELWKMEGRVEHDVWYIEHWSLSLDIKIMVRTVLNAIHGEENAF